mmetsp:Transcript_44122/g.133710  ORF Transcript_44122/g.133710 Transcript_44122/m.133710 type:complete len:215 (+) Transcript_44122:624-1268(+)
MEVLLLLEAFFVRLASPRAHLEKALRGAGHGARRSGACRGACRTGAAARCHRGRGARHRCQRIVGPVQRWLEGRVGHLCRGDHWHAQGSQGHAQQGWGRRQGAAAALAKADGDRTAGVAAASSGWACRPSQHAEFRGGSGACVGEGVADDVADRGVAGARGCVRRRHLLEKRGESLASGSYQARGKGVAARSGVAAPWSGQRAAGAARRKHEPD